MIERVRIPKRKEGRAPPNRKTFTALWLRRVRPPKAGQELYWDEGHKGLSLLVSRGGAKTFRSTFKVVKSTDPDVRDGWYSRAIGRFDEMVADADPDIENINIVEARKIVTNDRALARKGIDPRKPAQLEQAKSKLTYEAAVDQFIELYAKPRQRTWDQTERILKNYCKDWHRRPIVSITKRDAYTLLDRFKADGHDYKAAITLRWLKTLWKWAWRRDIVPVPIMEAVDIDYERRVRDRVYSDAELAALWKAADKLDDPTEGAYFKLLILLTPRKTALALMKRSELDDPDNPKLWTVPFELTKSKKTSTKKRVYLVPLPPLAQRILKGMPKTDDARLFPAMGVYVTKAGSSIFHDSKNKRRYVAAGAPSDFKAHAVRHTLGTWLENQGHSEFERGVALSHSGGGSVTAAYSHGYPLQLKRTLLEKWAAHIEQLVQPHGAALLR